MSQDEDRVDLERRAEELEQEAKRIASEDTPERSRDECQQTTKERLDEALSGPLEKLKKLSRS
jgi:hypothetical protein